MVNLHLYTLLCAIYLVFIVSCDPFYKKGHVRAPFYFGELRGRLTVISAHLGRAFFSRRLFKWGSTFFFFTISPFKKPSAEKSSFFNLKIKLRSEEFVWSKFVRIGQNFFFLRQE